MEIEFNHISGAPQGWVPEHPVTCRSDGGEQLGVLKGNKYSITDFHPTLRSIKVAGIEGWIRASWFF